jgi:hypothetical protein
LQIDGERKDRNQSGFQSNKGYGKGADIEVAGGDLDVSASSDPSSKGITTLLLELRGAKSVSRLMARLGEIDGVVSVQTGSDTSLFV